MGDPVTAAAGDLARGRLLVLVDEGEPFQPELIQAAEHVEAATVNFMVRFARGVVSVALPPDRRAALSLPLIPATGRGADRRRIAVSVESARGVTTGISAADRARTIRVLADPAAGPSDLRAPGHVVPIVAHPRAAGRPYGLPEAAVDIGRRAGLGGVVAVCTILDERGDVAGRDAVRSFCERHGLRTVSVAAIRRAADEPPAIRRATDRATVRHGRRIERSHGGVRGVEYLTADGRHVVTALVIGDPARAPGPVPVSVHATAAPAWPPPGSANGHDAVVVQVHTGTALHATDLALATEVLSDLGIERVALTPHTDLALGD